MSRVTLSATTELDQGRVMGGDGMPLGTSRWKRCARVTRSLQASGDPTVTPRALALVSLFQR